jgi:hypothetical protein
MSYGAWDDVVMGFADIGAQTQVKRYKSTIDTCGNLV